MSVWKVWKPPIYLETKPEEVSKLKELQVASPSVDLSAEGGRRKSAMLLDPVPAAAASSSTTTMIAYGFISTFPLFSLLNKHYYSSA